MMQVSSVKLKSEMVVARELAQWLKALVGLGEEFYLGTHVSTTIFNSSSRESVLHF